jgi:hypothetical protein
MAVGGTPSLSISRRMSLSATVDMSRLSMALYTMPYVPSPIFSTRS